MKTVSVYRYSFKLLLFVIFTGCGREHGDDIDRLFEAFTGEHVPGAAVMVIENGKPIVIKTYGTADSDNHAPVTTHTNFRLASVTKQFTAMCIMMLVERGNLSFDSVVTDIFPNFPAYGRYITVRHLLQHTSGLISYESLIPDDATEQVLDRDVLRMMAQQDSTYFAPGSDYRYSNSGYAMLAMIIEEVSGLTFARFLRKNIFDPLGMKNTVAYEDGFSEVTNRAYGYVLEDSVFVFSDQSLTSAVLGDGGIYTSLVDLFTWDQALYTETLVSYEMMKEAFTPGVLTDGTKLRYGYGWNIGKYRGHRQVWHNGGTCGFSTAIHRYPDRQLTVILLTNRRGANTNHLAEQIADIFISETGME